MSRFFSEKYAALTPYTPGEQPQNRQYIKLNTNESPFPPSPKALAYARAAAEDLNLYSDPTCAALTAKAAEVFGISEEEILFTNGSDDVLNFAFMAFCDDTHPARFPDITYGFYAVFAQQNRVPYTTVPLKEDLTMDIGDYLNCGSTIFLANPNAPTGIALPLSQIEAIVRSNPNNVVVIDEAYVDFGAESAVSLIHKYDNLLVTQTFSKSRSLAGGRLGFAIGCKSLIRDLNTLRYATNPYSVNRMTMAAGLGALEDEGYFRQNCAAIAKTRLWTTAALEALGFVVTPSLANFVFAAKDGVDGKELYARLKSKGVLVRHFDTPRLRPYLRITIGSQAQMAAFVEIVKEILEENP